MAERGTLARRRRRIEPRKFVVALAYCWVVGCLWTVSSSDLPATPLNDQSSSLLASETSNNSKSANSSSSSSPISLGEASTAGRDAEEPELKNSSSESSSSFSATSLPTSLSQNDATNVSSPTTIPPTKKLDPLKQHDAGKQQQQQQQKTQQQPKLPLHTDPRIQKSSTSSSTQIPKQTASESSFGTLLQCAEFSSAQGDTTTNSKTPTLVQQQQQHLLYRKVSVPDDQLPAFHHYSEVEDDRTLLDLFGEVAKEYLTQHLIPATDAECDWNWKHGRCEPYCHCEFRPMLGDYHLGRSCRRLEGDEVKLPHVIMNASGTFHHPSPAPALTPCAPEAQIPPPLFFAAFVKHRHNNQSEGGSKQQQQQEPPLIVLHSRLFQWWQQHWTKLSNTRVSQKVHRAVYTVLHRCQGAFLEYQAKVCHVQDPSAESDNYDDDDDDDDDVVYKDNSTTTNSPPHDQDYHDSSTTDSPRPLSLFKIPAMRARLAVSQWQQRLLCHNNNNNHTSSTRTSDSTRSSFDQKWSNLDHDDDDMKSDNIHNSTGSSNTDQFVQWATNSTTTNNNDTKNNKVGA